ncbi:UNVERIFIED_CONTAM: diacylglycerol kinase, partial [Bacteroidetes bacterium 56_B9]
MRTLKPLSIIYNQKSGFHASKHEDMYEQLMTVFTEFGFEIQVFELAEDVSFDDL